MMLKALFLSVVVLLIGCQNNQQQANRLPASILTEESSHLNEKLYELHYYTLIAHKHEIAGNMLKVRAARMKMDKIENDILKEAKLARYKVLRNLEDFAAISDLHSSTVSSLASKLSLRLIPPKNPLDFDKVLAEVKVTREFQVYETNVEHLSYMLETNARL